MNQFTVAHGTTQRTLVMRLMRAVHSDLQKGELLLLFFINLYA